MTDSYATWYLLALLFSSVFGVIAYVWIALGLGAVFAKLGVARWKAWVPYYNVVVLLGLGGLSGWLLLLLLIPIFGPIFVYVAIVTAAHRVGALFGYGPGMTVLAALLFPVWATVLGFGAARPVAPVPARPTVQAAERTDEASSFTALFDGGYGEEDLSARRSVPSPSAWIPPAPPMPSAPAAPATAPIAAPPAPAGASMPAPAATPWGEPSRAPSAVPADVFAADPFTAPAPVPAPAPDPYVAPAPDPVTAHAPDPFAAPAAVDPPVGEPVAPPVMSWWQPAIVDETDEVDDVDDAPHAAADLPDWARPVSSAPPAFAEPAAAAPAPATVEPPAFEPPAFEPPAVAPTPAEPTVEPAPAATYAPPAQAVLRESYLPESDAFPEASGEVSAVVGSPIAGPPRSAASSVAASRPGVGDFVEDTVIASRRRPKWALVLPDGSPLELSGDTAVLGRRPVPVHSAPGAQLVVVVDDTRTVSKTHAVLRRRADAWMIADLGSTNGVVVLEGDAEVEVAPGAEHEVQETFLLGDAVVRVVRTDA